MHNVVAVAPSTQALDTLSTQTERLAVVSSGWNVDCLWAVQGIDLDRGP